MSKKGLEAWFKSKALSSNPSITKKKKKRKKECARQKTPLLAAITMLVRVT
jgi:hypothetical protein